MLRKLPARDRLAKWSALEGGSGRISVWRPSPASLLYPARLYLDLELTHAPEVQLDAAGVAMEVSAAPGQDSPLAPSLEGLHLANGLTANAARIDELATLLKQADHLAKLVDSGGQLRYTAISVGGRTLENMPSALSSGLGLSLLVRAHAISGSGVYQGAIRSLLDGLRQPVTEGGPCRYESVGPVLLEYPGAGKYALVLNGWLSGMIGLLEAAGPADQEFARRAYRSLVAEMHKFDYALGHRYARDWSRLSGGEYPALVCFQLAHLWLLTGESRWAALSRRWTRFVDWDDLARRHHGLGAEVRLAIVLNA